MADATRDDRFARDPYFTDLTCCSLLAVPILSRGALQAVLLLENRLIRGAFTTERLDAVKLIAGQLAVSLDNAHLYTDYRRRRRGSSPPPTRPADASNATCTTAPNNGWSRWPCNCARRRPPCRPTWRTWRTSSTALAGEAIAALDELREIAHGIHPAVLTTGGLGPALRTLARRSPIPVELHVHADGRLPEPVEIGAYYIVAEALTNTAKHAHASAVTVTVETTTDTDTTVLRLTVHDDGVGGADFTRGTGLLGLKDRVEALGGRITLHSPPGEGTTLRAEIPLTPAHSTVVLPPRPR